MNPILAGIYRRCFRHRWLCGVVALANTVAARVERRALSRYDNGCPFGADMSRFVVAFMTNGAVQAQNKLDHARNLTLWAILCLTIAITLVVAIFFTFGSGFAAAALVAIVSAYLIPKIIEALNDYAGSRGPSDLCILKTVWINIIGQVITILGAVAFGTAAALEIAALAAFASLILAWLGVTLEAAVLDLVNAGIALCVTAIGILLALLANAYSYRKCMDKQDAGSVVL